MKKPTIRYRGFEIRRENGRYYVYAPGGRFVDSTDDFGAATGLVDRNQEAA